MTIPIEIRSKKLSDHTEDLFTLVKLDLSEAPTLVPNAVSVNGKWFVPADTARSLDESASWEAMNSQA